MKHLLAAGSVMKPALKSKLGNKISFMGEDEDINTIMCKVRVFFLYKNKHDGEHHHKSP